MCSYNTYNVRRTMRLIFVCITFMEESKFTFLGILPCVRV